MATPAKDFWTATMIETRLDDSSEIANRVGVHRNTVLNWKSGRTEPTLSQGLKLSKVVGVPVENLDAHLQEQRRRTKGERR